LNKQIKSKIKLVIETKTIIFSKLILMPKKYTSIDNIIVKDILVPTIKINFSTGSSFLNKSKLTNKYPGMKKTKSNDKKFLRSSNG
jgi:hypothetical protein